MVKDANIRQSRKTMMQAVGFNFYDVFVVGFCVIFALICFYPMWYVLVASVTPYEQFVKGGALLWPNGGVDFQYYKMIFENSSFVTSLWISASKTVLGTFLSVLVTSTMAYAASKSITLPSGDGLKTVYVKVRDAVGNETTAASDSITLDTSVPTVTVTGPDKATISKVVGFDMAVINFMSDISFEEYKVCVVPATSSTQESGVVIPTDGGSVNTSGNAGGYEADTNIEVKINGTDLETASSGDGVKIVKVFVKNAAGTWSTV